MKNLLKIFLASVILYVLIICVASVAVLSILSAIGYVPYSDRPGPGWQSPHLPNIEEINFNLNWAVFMAVNIWPWIAGALLFMFVRLLAYFNSPRWLLRLLSALLSGVATVFITLIYGWYIALSGAASLLISILALIFGAIVLPLFAPPRPTVLGAKLRWLGISITTLLFFSLSIYPFLPNKNLQSLIVHVFQITAGEELSEKDLTLTPDEIRFLKSHGVGNVDQLMSRSITYGSNVPEAEAIVILREKNAVPIKLNQPKQTRILYLQSEKGWETYPPGIPTIDKKFVISSDQNVEIE